MSKSTLCEISKNTLYFYTSGSKSGQNPCGGGGGGQVKAMAWPLPRTFRKAMKICQKYEAVFDRILMIKATPRVLFGSPWSLPKRLRKRLRSRHSFLNLKYISVIANYTFAFMQKPLNHLCFTVFFTHATFSKGPPTCKQKLSQNDTSFISKVILNPSKINV